MNTSPTISGSDLATKGFTLIEVIVTILVIAVLGSLMVTALGPSLTHSTEAAASLAAAYDLQSTMEAIRQTGTTNTLADLSALIGPEGASRNNQFGVYDVIHNRSIDFVANQEQPSGATTNLLKITIQGQSGETLTLLLRE